MSMSMSFRSSCKINLDLTEFLLVLCNLPDSQYGQVPWFLHDLSNDFDFRYGFLYSFPWIIAWFNILINNINYSEYCTYILLPSKCTKSFNDLYTISVTLAISNSSPGYFNPVSVTISLEISPSIIQYWYVTDSYTILNRWISRRFTISNTPVGSHETTRSQRSCTIYNDLLMSELQLNSWFAWMYITHYHMIRQSIF